MFNKATFALLLTAGMLTNAFAAQDQREPPRTYSSERPIETDITGLPLPRAVPGSMTLRPCSTCTPATLELTTAARFFVDGKPVSFADLRTLAKKSSANAVVFYDIKTNAVTRIVVTDVH
jgi:hypothetical protein